MFIIYKNSLRSVIIYQTTQFFNIGKRFKQPHHKRWYRKQISIWKGARHRSSLGECKLKPQWDTSTHLLEWPQLIFLKVTPSVAEDVVHIEHSHIACKYTKSHSRWKTDWRFPVKVNKHLPYNPATPCLPFTQKKQELTLILDTNTGVITSQFYSWSPKTGNSAYVFQVINRSTSCHGSERGSPIRQEKTELGIHTAVWMPPKCIMLSERSPAQKARWRRTAFT